MLLGSMDLLENIYKFYDFINSGLYRNFNYEFGGDILNQQEFFRKKFAVWTYGAEILKLPIGISRVPVTLKRSSMVMVLNYFESFILSKSDHITKFTAFDRKLMGHFLVQ